MTLNLRKTDNDISTLNDDSNYNWAYIKEIRNLVYII